MHLLKALWNRWKLVARKIADVQARFILSTFYFVALGPVALAMRAADDPLGIRHQSGAGWLPRPVVEGELLTSARRQF